MSKVELNKSLTSENVKEEIALFVKEQEKQKKALRRLWGIGSVFAIALLLAILLLPVLKIYGTGMAPTLNRGDIVVSMKAKEVDQGDLISFYYNNNILVKRVIACAGEWVDIDQGGNVFVNGKLLDEPYLSEKTFGKCDIILPYQVPEGYLFVMGDHRQTSIDSSSGRMGAITTEKVVGKIAFRLWPLNRLGKIE